MTSAGTPAFGAGSRIGPYEIVAFLGAGGMGEVYRAHDPRLAREIAIKVLRAGTSLDPVRQARFEQEARAAGALNHPNVLAVFDTGRHDGQLYVVFELLDGHSLRRRLASDSLTVAKVVDLAVQIAHGLAAAHDRGIVHRDLKPDNVFVTSDGRAKILDFGLAKLHAAFDEDAPSSDVETPSDLTSPGAVLGTAAYMSPEQVRGQRADVRSDIFSFGALLYEMLCARRAFEADTAAETMTAILKEDPLVRAQEKGDVPPALRQVLRRCLEKQPEERFQSAHDLALALEVAAASAALPETRPRRRRRPGRGTSLVMAMVLLAGTVVGTSVLRPSSRHRPGPPARAARFTIPLPEGTSVATRTSSVAISRDGTMVAVVAQKTGEQDAIYVRALEQWEWRRLAATEGGWSPFFSPDGAWLGFFARGKLKRVPVAGGDPVVVCDIIAGATARWDDDDRILFTGGLQPAVWIVPAGGGIPEVLVRQPDAGVNAATYEAPASLGGGQLLVSTWTVGRMRVETVGVAGPARRPLVEGGYGHVVATGHLVYSLDNQLFAIGFDRGRLATRGVGVPLVNDLRHTGVRPSGDFAVSETGTLVYVPDPRPQKRLAWVDAAGSFKALSFPTRDYQWISLSPDGSRLAVTIVEGSRRDLWVGELRRGLLFRLTADGDAVYSVWSPDGRDVLYTSSQGGEYNVFRRTVDGTGEAVRVTAGPNAKKAESWSPDGRTLLLNDVDPVTRADIWALTLDGDGKPRPLIKTMANEQPSDFSPDGRSFAYISDESGRYEVYVQSYPSLDRKVAVSTGGGLMPSWGPDGRELFFIEGDQLISVPISSRPELRVGKARVVLRGPMVEATRRAGTEKLTRDGKTFLLLEDLKDEATAGRLHVVRDWFDEFDRCVPVK